VQTLLNCSRSDCGKPDSPVFQGCAPSSTPSRRSYGGAATHARHQIGRVSGNFADHFDRLPDRIDAAAEPGNSGRIDFSGLIDFDLKCVAGFSQLSQCDGAIKST
jgi:hypothetical protein